MAERKTAELKIRVNPSELEAWKAAASKRDIHLSAFVRAACNESLAVDAGPVESQVPTITTAGPREFLAPAIAPPETGRRCPHGRQSGQWCPVCDR